MIERERALANWVQHVGRSRPCSREEMEARVARFKALPSTPRAFADTAIPEHERVLMSVIGMGATDNPDFRPAVPFAEHFHVDYIVADTGKGAALHAHDTEEVFVAISGRWMVLWGDSGEQHVVLEQGDVISVPPHVMRAFKNLDPGRQLMLSILGGKDPGRVKWAGQVAEAAKARGVGFDDDGNVVCFEG